TRPPSVIRARRTICLQGHTVSRHTVGTWFSALLTAPQIGAATTYNTKVRHGITGATDDHEPGATQTKGQARRQQPHPPGQHRCAPEQERKYGQAPEQGRQAKAGEYCGASSSPGPHSQRTGCSA